MAKRAARPITVTLKHLAAAAAEEYGLAKKQVEEILTRTVVRIARHLRKGDKFRIVGLGILQVRRRAARDAAKGEAVPIKATRKVALRAAKELADAI